MFLSRLRLSQPWRPPLCETCVTVFGIPTCEVRIFPECQAVSASDLVQQETFAIQHLMGVELA